MNVLCFINSVKSSLSAGFPPPDKNSQRRSLGMINISQSSSATTEYGSTIIYWFKSKFLLRTVGLSLIKSWSPKYLFNPKTATYKSFVP